MIRFIRIIIVYVHIMYKCIRCMGRNAIKQPTYTSN